jgi:hypothetical protein
MPPKKKLPPVTVTLDQKAMIVDFMGTIREYLFCDFNPGSSGKNMKTRIK